MNDISDRELLDATQIAYIDIDAKDIKGYKDQHGTEPTLEQLTQLESGAYSKIKDQLTSQEHQVAWKDVKDWQVLAVKDDNYNTGMYACILQPAGKEEVVLAFRGSEDILSDQLWKDWIQNDLGLLNSILTPQQEAAQGLIASHRSLLLAHGYYLTGHSLGGNLAESSAVFSVGLGMDAGLKGFTNFDGPSFSDEFIKNNSSSIAQVADRGKHFAWSVVGTLLYPLPGVSFQYKSAANYMSGLWLAPPIIEKHSTANVRPFLDKAGNLASGDPDSSMKITSGMSKQVENKYYASFVAAVLLYSGYRATRDFIDSALAECVKGFNTARDALSKAARTALVESLKTLKTFVGYMGKLTKAAWSTLYNTAATVGDLMVLGAVLKGAKARDFTLATQERILRLLRQGNDCMCQLTSWLGDSVLSGPAQALGIVAILAGASAYQQHLFAVNDSSEWQLQKAFSEAYALDAKYASRFKEHTRKLASLRTGIKRCAAVVTTYA